MMWIWVTFVYLIPAVITRVEHLSARTPTLDSGYFQIIAPQDKMAQDEGHNSRSTVPGDGLRSSSDSKKRTKTTAKRIFESDYRHKNDDVRCA
jgi:hypothetical protein